MGWTNSIRRVKLVLVVTAVMIAAVSLVVSHKLISDLKAEEVAKMEVWAEAMRALMTADEHTDLNLVLQVINGNHSIPVVVADEQGNVSTYRNLELSATTAADSLAEVKRLAASMRADGLGMKMQLSEPTAEAAPEYIYIYYSESLMLQRLTAFPYVQLGVVSLFIVVAIFALLASKRAEQNKVWVGLSKETAHQLGTPISSLMAWIAVFKENYPDDELLPEMQTDVERLERIAERFSKIGSAPELKPATILPLIERSVDYVKRRVSSRVQIEVVSACEPITLPLSQPLMEWVIEVICKNAVDAMSGEGRITIELAAQGKRLAIELTDTGKGIARKDFRTIFKPGYTTKRRGWGLGLSLAKRIVEEYHHGRIFVKHSQLHVGTTFRVELPLD